ncbi:hypothetical protein [Catenuloplanes japonicus]|uniref:hypothetical protein n=1 Tax=Catenuloplanes japonicus TaxID=33876 RepID=UPI000525F015|nr:hypothetical protein [Catenuloplanes japonicus]
MTNIRNDLAEHIRRTDGGNKLTAHELGMEIAVRVVPLRLDLYGDDVIAFVEATNPDKTMGAGALADAIVDHFGLDGEEAA